MLLLRAAAAPSARAVTRGAPARRAFATANGAAAAKFRGALEEYRLQNYSRETPMRFKKEILNAAREPGADFIRVDALNRILVNIGRPDQLLSEEEMASLLREVGAKDRCLKASQLLELV